MDAQQPQTETKVCLSDKNLIVKIHCHRKPRRTAENPEPQECGGFLEIDVEKLSKSLETRCPKCNEYFNDNRIFSLQGEQFKTMATMINLFRVNSINFSVELVVKGEK